MGIQLLLLVLLPQLELLHYNGLLMLHKYRLLLSYGRLLSVLLNNYGMTLLLLDLYYLLLHRLSRWGLLLLLLLLHYMMDDWALLLLLQNLLLLLL